MREILFRGKRIDNGEWVYGDLSQHKTGKIFIKCGSAIHSYEVIPDTVGQYAGLTDKNGKKIFEGDILGHVYKGQLRTDGVVMYGAYNCSCCDGVYGWYVEGGDIRAIEDMCPQVDKP